MSNRKKRVLFLTDYAGINTGFGKNIKLLLSYLYKTKKYDLFHAACGIQTSKDCEKFPWKTIGVIPNDPHFIQRMQQDGHFARMASYGEPQIGKIVEEVKPDIVFAIQDSWGALFVTDKPFFKKIPTVCWITFDSLPLLADTIEKADKIENYWTWSDFAEHEFHRLGFKHVKTQYPLTNTKNFFPLSNLQKAEIRKKHNIDENSKIFGFVFRNQLRKLVGTLIAGYAEFLKQNPEMENKSKLYLHTHFGEGWDIARFIDQYNIPKNNIICTYVCKETHKYFILPYSGQDIENPITKKKTLITANVQLGVTDDQLNEIYNIMDAYLHPATSGACEIPIVEAALTEKIVSTCDYSFGWNVVHHNDGCIPMDYSFYNEPPMGSNTQFLKSQPYPSSIAKIMKKICEMKPQRRREMEQASRKWALDNYSVDVNGSKIEKFIDTVPLISDENIWIDKEDKKINPDAPIDQIEDNLQWIIQLYNKILDAHPDKNDEGVKHWMLQMERGMPKENVESYFRNVARNDLNKDRKQSLEDLLDPNDSGRVLYVMPESAGDIFLSTALFKSIKNRYPEYSLYVATKPEYKSILDGNEFVHKWIEYKPEMDNLMYLEGNNSHKGFFDIAYLPYTNTQRCINYLHNGLDKIDFNIENKQ